MTALLEILADLRPNTKAIAEYEELFGTLPPVGIVPWGWRQKNALAEATIVAGGPLVRIDAYETMRELERTHARLLATHAISHLDISAVRAKDRIVTQTLSRSLYDGGASGIAFGSNENDRLCYACFEARARLRARGPAAPLTDDHPDLIDAAKAMGLVLGTSR